MSAASDQAFVLLCCSSDSNTSQSGDGALEQAFQSLSLKHHLDTLQESCENAKLAFLPGAGALYMEGCEYALLDNRWLALFVGEIDNYAYCVKKYCLKEAGLDVNGSYLLETVRALSPLNNAEEAAILFKTHGPTYMSKLRGQFSFVVYDALKGCVLAVNDTRGSNSLWQGHISSDNSLVVACNFAQLPLEIIEKGQITAGQYKFGWRSEPLPYMASSEAVMSRCTEARQAALDALACASTPIPSASLPTPGAAGSWQRNRRNTFGTSSSTNGRQLSASGGSNTVVAAGSSPGSVYAVSKSCSAVLSSPGSRPGSYIPPHRRSTAARPSVDISSPGLGLPTMVQPTKRTLDRRHSYSHSWRRSTAEDQQRPWKVHDQRSSDQFTPVLMPPPEEDAKPGDQRTSNPPAKGQTVSDAASPKSYSLGRPKRCQAAGSEYHMAASSLLFQPAKLERRQEQPLEVQEPLDVQQPSLPDSHSSDGDLMTWPSYRSHPIPIRPSHESRPSTDHAVTEADDCCSPDLPNLAEHVADSSLESVICTSDSGGSVEYDLHKTVMKRSSLMFPCSDAESSLSASVSGHNGSLSPSLHHGSFLHTSRSTLEAKQLLDQVAKSWSAHGRSEVSLVPHNVKLSSANGSQELGQTPRLNAPSEEPESFNAESSNTSMRRLDPWSSHVKEYPPGDMMKTSGSFSDALQLLLQARTGNVPAANPGPWQFGPPDVAPMGATVQTGSSQALATLQPDREEHCANDSSVAGPGTADASSLRRRSESLHTIPSSLLAAISGGAETDVAEKAALASLVYSSPCSLCIVDAQAPDQPIMYVNSQFLSATGYEYDEVIGRNCRFLQAPPNRRRAPSMASMAIHRALLRGHAHRSKLINYTKDGRPLWNELSIVPVRAKSTLQITHFIGLQRFTPADVVLPEAAAAPAPLTRGSSHQCLLRLDHEISLPPSSRMSRASSHMVLLDAQK